MNDPVVWWINYHNLLSCPKGDLVFDYYYGADSHNRIEGGDGEVVMALGVKSSCGDFVVWLDGIRVTYIFEIVPKGHTNSFGGDRR